MVSQLRLRALAAASDRSRDATPQHPQHPRSHDMAATTTRAGAVSNDGDEPHSAPENIGDDAGGYSDEPAGSDGEPSSPTAKRPRLEDDQDVRVDTRDGHTKLYINGFEFTRSNITRVKISYRCSFYRSQGCAARLEFLAATMDYDMANMVPHTCLPPSLARPDLNEASRLLVVRNAMQRDVDALAIEDSSSPQRIWEQLRDKYYNRADNVIARGVSKSQVIKRINHVRAQHFGADIHGRVEVAPLSRVKLTTLNFFQFHHVWTSAAVNTEQQIDRLIGWAHPALLALLRYGDLTLFVDATFRCVPRTFRQCVVLMVYDRASKLFVPVFYVLMASKTYDSYWNLFQYVSDAVGDRVAPTEVVCDFEIGLIRAVRDWFPDTDIVGCFFHFKQACQRKMSKLCIPRAEIDIAMSRGVLDMLTVIEHAAVDPDGIRWVRREIKRRCQAGQASYSSKKWKLFWAYFRHTWLNLLPPSLWNVSGIRRDVVARTNNPLERFNRELNSSFTSPHPSIAQFVSTIDDISRRYVKLRDDIIRGLATPPKRQTRPNLPSITSLPDTHDGSDAEAPSDESNGQCAAV